MKIKGMSMQPYEKELVLSQDQIQEKVRELAMAISRDYKSTEPVLVGILNGVFMFFADLVRNLSIPVQIDFIRLVSYGSRNQTSGNVRMMKDVELNITGRDVLVVEDIVDSGHTLAFLKTYLEQKSCRSVKICTLIDKRERREKAIGADYTGFTVEKGFLVGYGLDFDEKFRYLPSIYHLKFE
jgi:hypoxanthine phosphoribosyltransferase